MQLFMYCSRHLKYLLFVLWPSLFFTVWESTQIQIIFSFTHLYIYIILTIRCCYWILIELHSLFHKDQCNGSSHIIAYHALVLCLFDRNLSVCAKLFPFDASLRVLFVSIPRSSVLYNLIIPTTFLWGLFLRYESSYIFLCMCFRHYFTLQASVFLLSLPEWVGTDCIKVLHHIVLALFSTLSVMFHNLILDPHNCLGTLPQTMFVKWFKEEVQIILQLH